MDNDFKNKLKATRELLTEVSKKTGSPEIRCNSITLLSYLPLISESEIELFLKTLSKENITGVYNGKKDRKEENTNNN